MENLTFNWHANLDASAIETADHSLVISGELVNASICSNNFALDEPELPKLADQVKEVTLRVDHSKSARDVIGGFRIGKYEADRKRVMFEAEVDDPIIQRSIMKGRLKYISIGATADAFCSGCGKSTKPFKICKCKNSHDVIRNIKLKEASIITEPAYQTSKFEPVGFIASITSALAENQVTAKASEEAEAGPFSLNKKMEEKREMSTNENKVEATTLKPAGTDAVVLLGQKLEALAAMVTKMEERWKKEDEERKKKDEDEAKKKSEDEVKKKDEALINVLKTEFANLSTKLEEAFKPKKEECKVDEAKKEDKATFTNVPAKGGIPKDVKHEAKKEPPAEEEEEEEEKVKTKKEVVKAGAKVEDASETQVEVTAEAIPPWFNEVKAFARKNNILD